MTVETHAIILNEGEDVIRKLFGEMESGELMTRLTPSSFARIAIKNLKFVRIADPHETGGRGGKSIWVEVTINF